jgi:histidinol-phosphate phosphatase family protein
MNRDVAIFVDRDGTLIEEVKHLTEIEQIRMIATAVEAIRRANQAGVRTVVITNQSVIARGYLTEEGLKRIHEDLRLRFREGGARLDAFYYCPHHPDQGTGPFVVDCNCRKPKPGMLLQASAEMGLDLHRSVMIGDTLGDVEAGHRAGAKSVLVETGYGAQIAAELGRGCEAVAPLAYPDYIASDILQAVNWSLEKIGERTPG